MGVIENPEIPYVGPVDGGLVPGKMVKVQGKVPPNSVRFAVNYQLGPTLNPRDDIAIHVSPRFDEGFVTRNHIESMRWGMEENDGPMWIQPGQEFEILLLCEHSSFKIAINGRHFAEFLHRLPYQRVTHLVVDGDVEVHLISYETIHVDPPRSPRAVNVPDVPPVDFGPPPPGGLYPTLNPQTPQAGYGHEYGPPPPQGYGPPPPQGYGPPPPQGYGPPPPQGYGGVNPPRAYGYEKAEEEDVFGGCLDKVGLALGGLVAAGGVAAAMHAINKKKDDEKEHEKSDASKTESHSESGLGNLGALGAALASSLASNALQGSNSQPQQNYPSQQPGGGGGMLGSILGALGGTQQPGYPAQPPPPSNDLGGTLGSILGGVLGGGGNQHQQPSYQPAGGYQSSGGYGPQRGSDNSNLLSGIGSAIGSSLFNSAMDGLSKHGKNKSHDESHQDRAPHYAMPNTPAHPQPTVNADSSSSSKGQKLTADEISKGLGLDD